MVLVRKSPATGNMEAVLVKNRYTYAFSEFVHGRYTGSDDKKLRALFAGMTSEERLLIGTLDFAQLWRVVWIDAASKRELYIRNFTKFQSEWLLRDGGSRLLRLSRRPVDGKKKAVTTRWSFPKGRRTSDRETDIGCAVREVQEETKISPHDYQLLPDFRRRVDHHHMGVHYSATYFVAVPNRASLEPQLDMRDSRQLAEVAEVRWMSLDMIRMVDSDGRLADIASAAFSYVKGHRRRRAKVRLPGDDCPAGSAADSPPFLLDPAGPQ